MHTEKEMLGNLLPAKASAFSPGVLIDRFKKTPIDDLGHNKVFIFFLLITIMFVLSKIDSYVLHQLENFLPWVVLNLTAADWQEFSWTCFAVLISFTLSTTLALLLAMITARLLLSKGYVLQVIGAAIQSTYQFIYIVPVIISISLLLKYTIPMQVDDYDPRIVWLLNIVLPTAFISGHPVFSSFVTAVTEPDERHRMLVYSIYERPVNVFRKRVDIGFSRVLRLAGGKVESICHDVRLSWHLAIVAVVIVEAVAPGIHIQVVPSWFPGSEGLGVGGAVAKAQSAIDLPRVFGFMWALFAFDWIGLFLMRRGLQAAYLKHYSKVRR